MMNDINLQGALNEANKERAIIYLAIFRELRKRHGTDEAIDVIRAALFERGRAFGETLKQYAASIGHQRRLTFAVKTQSLLNGFGRVWQ